MRLQERLLDNELLKHCINMLLAPRACGLKPGGHSRLSRRTAVYSPPKPPPRMHTRGPRAPAGPSNAMSVSSRVSNLL